MRNYKNIKAFQLADDLVVEIYKVTQQFPKEEIYGLTSQLRRAAVSVPSNIAEGASRQHQKDYLQFLYVARASLAETEYLLHLATKLGYLGNDLFTRVEERKQEVAKTLFGLLEAVKKDL